jgi:hypothetical protein
MTFPYVPVVGMGLQQIQVWNAPFPPPKAVSEYEQMLPGSWDRFLTMAEESQAAQILPCEMPRSIAVAIPNVATCWERPHYLQQWAARFIAWQRGNLGLLLRFSA